MICKKCGKEIDEGLSYCPFCGEPVETKNEAAPEDFYQGGQPAKKQAKCWKVFAKVSKILGIVAIATCIIPFVDLLAVEAGAAGIVFAILGKRADSDEAKSQAKLGLILSIIATAVGFISYIIYIAAIGGLGSVVVGEMEQYLDYALLLK